MELLQNDFDFLRHRQTEVCCIFHQRNTLIGDIEKDHSGTKNAACSDNINIQTICDADQKENQHLTTNTTKTHLAGKAVVIDGTHDTRDVINYNKGNQRIQQTITLIPKPDKDTTKTKSQANITQTQKSST